MTPTPEVIVKSFRVAELKECLTKIGLTRTGRKAEQQQRVVEYLRNLDQSRNGEQQRRTAERVITEMYERMMGWPPGQYAAARGGSKILQQPAEEQIHQSSVPTDAHAFYKSVASKGNTLPNGRVSTVNGKLAINAAHSNTQIRCLCDLNIDRGHMVQCEGEGCGIWQHCACVSVDARALPAHFFCETCTVQRADPFWRTISSHAIMNPARLLPSMHPSSYSSHISSEPNMQSLERIVVLNPATVEPLRRSAHDHALQIACVLLGDEVPFRVQWPKNADLRMNNMRLPTGRRNITHALGANARDEPVNLASHVLPGRNCIKLNANDGRSFCLLMLLVRRRSQADVEAMMAPAETPDAAYARVRRQAADDDIEIASTIVSLRCPMTGARVARAGRFQGIDALGAFDLNAFLSMAAQTRKWQCPLTMRHSCVQQLHTDAFIQGIIDRLQSLPEVMEVEVSPEGMWRPASSRSDWLDFRGGPLPPTAQVKAEPSVMKWRGQVLSDGKQPDSDSEESEDEEMEMRKAAAAVKAQQARKRPKPDVIVISDSDDDEPDARRRAAPSASQQRAASTSMASLQHALPNGHRSPDVSHESRPSPSQSSRLPMRTSGSTSTSNAGYPSYMNAQPPRGMPPSTSAAPMHSQGQHPPSTSAAQPFGGGSRALLRGAQWLQQHQRPQQQSHQHQPQQQQSQQQQQHPHNPLRIRIRPPSSSRVASPPGAPSTSGYPYTSTAQPPVPASSPGLPVYPTGYQRMATAVTAASGPDVPLWQHMPQGQGRGRPTEQVAQSPMDTSATSRSHQQQAEQQRDPWAQKGDWMDGLFGNNSSRSESPWGPPLPPPDPPIPTEAPASGSDVPDWLGLLLDQEAPASSFDSRMPCFDSNGVFSQSGRSGPQDGTGLHEVIELSP